MSAQRPCPDCNGSGRVGMVGIAAGPPPGACPDCNGTGRYGHRLLEPAEQIRELERVIATLRPDERPGPYGEATYRWRLECMIERLQQGDAYKWHFHYPGGVEWPGVPQTTKAPVETGAEG